MSPALIVFAVFTALVLASAVIVSWVHQRRSIENFRAVERERTQR